MGRAARGAWGGKAERERLKFFIEDPGTGALYRRGQLLGKGAFGRCYKFTDTSTNKIYAVKVVSQSRVSWLDNRGKVEREIELHRQLKHRNIVAFHRHFADQENVYMVLEYCSRKSLAHILKARKELTEPEVRFYLKQIIAGLQYLHRQGIIHRDLKLSNLFISSNMQVKIGDLGLAAREEQAGQRRGVICGTPNYLAPEVVAKKGHSAKSDVWALGCIMYTALMGFPPFEVAHKQEMYRRIQEGRYPAPDRLSPDAQELIGKLLAPDPEARPSLEEVLSHPFFTQGFTPDKLSSRTSHAAPIFTLPNALRKFFQKAVKLLFWRPPCHGSRIVNPPPLDPIETQVAPFCPPTKTHQQTAPARRVSISPKEEEKGSRGGPEEPSAFPVHLLMRGSLNGSRTNGGADWHPGGILHTVDQALQRCLRTAPLAEKNPKGSERAAPIRMVTKWVDYSNKYGFGYLLSSGSTGVLLRDGTHLALCPQHRRVGYCTGQREAASFFPRHEAPAPLAAKMAALHFFTQYMQRRLMEGGQLQSGAGHATEDAPLLHFAKSDEALLMVFSDGTLQVNFYHDRTKIVLSRSAGGHLLTFVDRQRRSTTFPLRSLEDQGWTRPLQERVTYALHMLRQL